MIIDQFFVVEFLARISYANCSFTGDERLSHYLYRNKHGGSICYNIFNLLFILLYFNLLIIGQIYLIFSIIVQINNEIIWSHFAFKNLSVVKNKVTKNMIDNNQNK